MDAFVDGPWTAMAGALSASWPYPRLLAQRGGAFGASLAEDSAPVAIESYEAPIFIYNAASAAQPPRKLNVRPSFR